MLGFVLEYGYKDFWVKDLSLAIKFDDVLDSSRKDVQRANAQAL